MSANLTIDMPVDLPPELVCKIFLHAAKSSTSSCLALCAVSTWTRRIALPHLYTTVSITHTSAASFLRSTAKPPVLPPSTNFRPTESIRHLWADCSGFQLQAIVQRCPNISHISIHSGDLVWFLCADLPPLLHSSATVGEGYSLHMLMFHHFPRYSWSFRPPHAGHIFERITHLRLAGLVDFRTELFVDHMHHLTHFAVLCSDADVGDLPCVLPVVRNTSVEVFVLVLSDNYLSTDRLREVEEWVRDTRREEERIYAVRPLCDELEEEWEVEVRGGQTVWERASEYTQLLMSRETKYPPE